MAIRRNTKSKRARASFSMLLVVALACMPLLFGIPLALANDDVANQQEAEAGKAPVTSTDGLVSGSTDQGLPGTGLEAAGNEAPTETGSALSQATTANSAETAATMGILAVPEGVALDEGNFPDPALRAYVKNMLDTDGNGYISNAEMKATYVKYIAGLDIVDLKGVELLDEGSVYISNTSATILDMTGTKAFYVDARGNPNLEKYIIKDAPSINSVNAHENPKLTEVEFGNLGPIVYVYVQDNDLRKLDFSGNVIGCVECRENPNLSEITGISNQASLSYFSAENCAIASLDISNCPKMYSLVVSNNQLSYLNVDGDRKLAALYADGNHLLDVRGLSNAVASWQYPQNYKAGNQTLTIPVEYDEATGKYTSIGTYDMYNMQGNVDIIRWETPKPEPEYEYIEGWVDYGWGEPEWEIIDVVEIPNDWVDVPDVVIGYYDASSKRFVIDSVEDANFSISNAISTMKDPYGNYSVDPVATAGTIHFTYTPPVAEDPSEVAVPPVDTPEAPNTPTTPTTPNESSSNGIPASPFTVIVTPVMNVVSSVVQMAAGSPTPLVASIDEGETPLAYSQGVCNVHFYMAGAMLLTIAYAAVVVTRRRKSSLRLQELEEEALGIRESKDAHSRADDRAYNREKGTVPLSRSN